MALLLPSPWSWVLGGGQLAGYGLALLALYVVEKPAQRQLRKWMKA